MIFTITKQKKNNNVKIIHIESNRWCTFDIYEKKGGKWHKIKAQEKRKRTSTKWHFDPLLSRETISVWSTQCLQKSATFAIFAIFAFIFAFFFCHFSLSHFFPLSRYASIKFILTGRCQISSACGAAKWKIFACVSFVILVTHPLVYLFTYFVLKTQSSVRMKSIGHFFNHVTGRAGKFFFSFWCRSEFLYIG